MVMMVRAGRKIPTRAGEGKKQEKPKNLLTDQAEKTTWREARTRQIQPRRDWMRRNSLQDIDEDTEGNEVMPRITATEYAVPPSS